MVRCCVPDLIHLNNLPSCYMGVLQRYSFCRESLDTKQSDVLYSVSVRRCFNSGEKYSFFSLRHFGHALF